MNKQLDLEMRDVIVAEHRKLGDLVQQLERNADPDRLPLMLDGLNEILARHFAREEAKNGLYDVLKTKAPDRQKRLGDLLGEHGVLLGTVAELRQRSNDHPASEGLGMDVARFCRHLRDHERRESRLLIDSLSSGRRGED